MIIRKNSCLFVIFLLSFSPFFCYSNIWEGGSHPYEIGCNPYQFSDAPQVSWMKNFVNPATWKESFTACFHSPQGKEFLRSLALSMYDYAVTNPELEELEEEGEELGITNKKLKRYRKHQKNMLRKSPCFVNEVKKLQLRSIKEAMK